MVFACGGCLDFSFFFRLHIAGSASRFFFNFLLAFFFALFTICVAFNMFGIDRESSMTHHLRSIRFVHLACFPCTVHNAHTMFATQNYAKWENVTVTRHIFPKLETKKGNRQGNFNCVKSEVRGELMNLLLGM